MQKKCDLPAKNLALNFECTDASAPLVQRAPNNYTPNTYMFKLMAF